MFARPSTCSPHRTFLYTVDIPGIGDVLKTDCCIRHANCRRTEEFKRAERLGLKDNDETWDGVKAVR
jgi:hypothetical protein